MIQTSYRATDLAPSTKVEMLNEYWASEDVPSNSFVHPIECNPKENPFNVQYVRTGNIPTSESTLMYDLGKTFVATGGQLADGNLLGDLWVTYEVELKKPLIHSSVTEVALPGFFSASVSAPTSSNYFAGTQAFDVKTNLDVTLPTTGKTFTLAAGQRGTYLVYYTLYASSYFTLSNFRHSPTFTNAVVADIMTSLPDVSPYLGGANAVIDYLTTACAFTVTDPAFDVEVTFGANTYTGTPVGGFITISRIA